MQNNNQPLISVVIPVRNCESTIYYTLKSVLNQTTQNFEVVVSDNYCDDDTAKVILSFKDEKIKYFKTDERLSMCDSYEFAASKAIGKYMIIIGGDDGIHQNALDRLEEEILNTNYKMYCWPVKLYKWPNNKGIAFEDDCNMYRFNSIKQIDTVSAAIANLKLGGWRYENLMTMLYHTCISMSIVKDVIKDHGRLFYTTQPDVYTSYVIPAYVKELKVIDKPITISGHSKHGNSAVTLDKNNKNYDKFMQEYGNYKIDESVPTGMPIREATLLEPLYVAKKRIAIYKYTKINEHLSWANVVCNTRYTGNIWTNWKICFMHTNLLDFLIISIYVLGIFLYKTLRNLRSKKSNLSLKEVSAKNIYDYSAISTS
ncbi:MAG: glycosyltransferase family 2 protein [Saprospiraceae bacterium]|nr:glycosyltransferase family 2 protein [Saprospiraceae bacterium]MBP7699047.1 glycosyltransferase family 2 protein [Saprospiraceae bacterium]